MSSVQATKIATEQKTKREENFHIWSICKVWILCATVNETTSHILCGRISLNVSFCKIKYLFFSFSGAEIMLWNVLRHNHEFILFNFLVKTERMFARPSFVVSWHSHWTITKVDWNVLNQLTFFFHLLFSISFMRANGSIHRSKSKWSYYCVQKANKKSCVNNLTEFKSKNKHIFFTWRSEKSWIHWPVSSLKFR